MRLFSLCFPIRPRIYASTLTIWGILLVGASRADWPEHRGNLQRTGFVAQPLNVSHWEPLWRFDELTAPKPAWPEAAQNSLWQKLDDIKARVTDDQADVALIVSDTAGNDHVLLTSSANDCLISVNPFTGVKQWVHFANAPIRYAPSVANGIAYLGADDGLVRAIDVSNGRTLWQTGIGPDMPWVIGNSRMVSSHPIRTSVLFRDGYVYATAGLFPSQGVYAVCLDSKTGQVVWRRQIKQSPQGYLLADDDNLHVPTGRGEPFVLKQSDGRFIAKVASPGGSFCILTPQAVFSGPGDTGSIEGKADEPNAKMLSFPGKTFAYGDGNVWSADGETLVCHRLFAAEKGEPEKVWSISCRLASALSVSGIGNDKILFVSGGRQINYYSATTGALRGTLQLPSSAGEVKYLAVSPVEDGKSAILVGTTLQGEVFAWRDSSDLSSRNWPEPNSATETDVPDDLKSVDRLHTVLKENLRSPRGWALVISDDDGALVKSVLSGSELRIMSVVDDAATAAKLRSRFMNEGLYGHRVTVWNQKASDRLPFSEGVFNAVIAASETSYSTERLLEMATPGAGFVWRVGSSDPVAASDIAGVGVWRHQYANPANTSATTDSVVGNAGGFRLLWFGGVGPSRMPDRHLRGPAPLAAGNAFVVQGDGCLIGIDPANGTERWHLDLPPSSMRYVMPYDAGYACLSETGSDLLVAAGKELWSIDPYTGRIIRRTDADQVNHVWGYVAESKGAVFATLMKASAARTATDKETRYSYVELDYKSKRPLVTSRELRKLTLSGSETWSYQPDGVIVNGSVAIDETRLVFLEARSPACVVHETDRISLSEIMQDGHLVCLSSESGEKLWDVSLDWQRAENILFVQIAGDTIILTTSASRDDKATYLIRTIDASTGDLFWEVEHQHIKKGLYHGEQVHHPVTLQSVAGRRILVAEPFLYDLKTGKRTGPHGKSADWSLKRPGHSCGTLSGAGNCLFFRAGNPTVLNLESGRFTALAPTRTGCWINMIPAGGRLLIPEGSASCVCNYSLQTSMAFVPISEDSQDSEVPFLPDVYPAVDAPLATPLYQWVFDSDSMSGQTIVPTKGDVKLQAFKEVQIDSNGIKLDGTQWMSNVLAYPRLPDMPETISLEAHVVVESAPEWAGIVGAVQDNGSYERGCMLGIHDGKLFFSLAGSQTGKLTYLHAPTPFETDQMLHVLGTYDGRMMKLYVNGKLVAQSSEQRGGLYIDKNSWLTVGAYKDKDEFYRFRGQIKSVTIHEGVKNVSPD